MKYGENNNKRSLQECGNERWMILYYDLDRVFSLIQNNIDIILKYAVWHIVPQNFHTIPPRTISHHIKPCTPIHLRHLHSANVYTNDAFCVIFWQRTANNGFVHWILCGLDLLQIKFSRSSKIQVMSNGRTQNTFAACVNINIKMLRLSYTYVITQMNTSFRRKSIVGLCGSKTKKSTLKAKIFRPLILQAQSYKKNSPRAEYFVTTLQKYRIRIGRKLKGTLRRPIDAAISDSATFGISLWTISHPKSEKQRKRFSAAD